MIDEITETTTRKITGTLKWFDHTKGFGFLTCIEYDEDVFLHESILADAIGRILLEGSQLEVLVQDFEQGVRATKILSIERPEGEEDSSLVEGVDSIPAIPARVKWFDKEKGFGFANAFRGTDDIFVHSSILNRYGIKELFSNEAVSLRVQDTDRGLVAVDICDWVRLTAVVV